jgi:hypothetical protein
MNDARRALPVLLLVTPLAAFVLAGGLTLALALLLSWPLPVALLGGFVGALVAFGWLMGRVIDALYPRPEPVALEPKPLETKNPEPQTTQVALIRENGNYPRGEYTSLSVDPERLYTFCAGVLNGRGMSISEWTGSRGIFSRSEFTVLRSELIERGFVRWVNEKSHAQGVELTRGGESFFKRIVLEEADALPPPLSEKARYVP